MLGIRKRPRALLRFSVVGSSLKNKTKEAENMLCSSGQNQERKQSKEGCKKDLLDINAGYRSPKTQNSPGHTPSSFILRHFFASVKYCGVVLKKRSLARGKPKDEVIR